MTINPQVHFSSFFTMIYYKFTIKEILFILKTFRSTYKKRKKRPSVANHTRLNRQWPNANNLEKFKNGVFDRKREKLFWCSLCFHHLNDCWNPYIHHTAWACTQYIRRAVITQTFSVPHLNAQPGIFNRSKIRPLLRAETVDAYKFRIFQKTAR